MGDQANEALKAQPAVRIPKANGSFWSFEEQYQYILAEVVHVETRNATASAENLLDALTNHRTKARHQLSARGSLTGD